MNSPNSHCLGHCCHLLCPFQPHPVDIVLSWFIRKNNNWILDSKELKERNISHVKCVFLKNCMLKGNYTCILEGFHGQGPMVVVGFLGCVAVFLRFSFLTFCQSLWLASSEDRSQNSVLCYI